MKLFHSTANKNSVCLPHAPNKHAVNSLQRKRKKRCSRVSTISNRNMQIKMKKWRCNPEALFCRKRPLPVNIDETAESTLWRQNTTTPIKMSLPTTPTLSVPQLKLRRPRIIAKPEPTRNAHRDRVSPILKLRQKKWLTSKSNSLKFKKSIKKCPRLKQIQNLTVTLPCRHSKTKMW